MGGKATYVPLADGEVKTCPACARALDASHFDVNRAAKDGLYTYCRDCRPTVKTPLADPKEFTDGQVKPAGIPPHVLNGLQIPDNAEQLLTGLWRWRSPKGWRVLALHYTADPKKRPGTPEGDAWKAAEQSKMSPRDWQREMEIDHTISEGEPFFTSFNRAIHIKPCVYNPQLPVLRAWDFGRGHPAVLWAQKQPNNQIQVLRSLLETQKSIFHFAPQVLAETNIWFPGANVFDYGDPAGAQETDKGQTTAILLHEFQIKLIYRFSFVETGLKMLERALIVREDGEAGLRLDPSNTILIDGLAGGYKLDIGASGRDTEGRMKNSPKKDGWYDHLVDCLRYLYINVFEVSTTKEHDRRSLQAISLWMTREEIKKIQEAEEFDMMGEFNA